METKSTLPARLIKLLGTAFAVYVAAELVGGIAIASFWTAIWVGLVLGLLNLIVKPFLTLISIPLIMLSFGLFLVVINAVLLLFCSDLIEAFTVDGFWPAVWGSLVISLVSMILEPKSPDKGNKNGNDRQGVRITIHKD
ncbi:UNVERIFIED_CONTAM: hypothetical protein GTU68_057267 [Idotea baltica]|nr:hypothetical protein [Idotea baltica]